MSGRLELERAPYATATWPGCGGAFKTVPEDFEVEEVPAYEPSGKGEHLFLWVEKRGVSTPEVASTLAQAVGLPEREVGYAGLKDKQGVTRQFFSIPARHEDRVGLFVLPGAQVLWGKRHGNKLRTGHLYGNRFVLRLRGVERPEAARAAFGALEEGGVPNFFGAQRFGAADTNAAAGKALILGQRLPARPSRFERKLFLSAYQSLLFNRALARRMEAGTWSQALPGDVMRKLPEGGVFRCDSPELDQPRVAAFEVSPAGPLFGPKMFEAADPVRAAEAALLVEEKVSLEDFRRGGDETEGGRRPYRVRMTESALVEDGSDLVLRCRLPKGSYATSVLRELLKASQRSPRPSER